MDDAWTLELTLPFLAGLELLRPRDVEHVREHVAGLAQDPTPDRKRKRHVKRLLDVVQLSVGDFRIFYSFEAPRVTVLAIHRRGDRGYYDFIMGEAPAAPDAWRFAARPLQGRLVELRRKERALGLSEVERAELRTLGATFPSAREGGVDPA